MASEFTTIVCTEEVIGGAFVTKFTEPASHDIKGRVFVFGQESPDIPGLSVDDEEVCLVSVLALDDGCGLLQGGAQLVVVLQVRLRGKKTKISNDVLKRLCWGCFRELVAGWFVGGPMGTGVADMEIIWCFEFWYTMCFVAGCTDILVRGMSKSLVP